MAVNQYLKQSMWGIWWRRVLWQRIALLLIWSMRWRDDGRPIHIMIIVTSKSKQEGGRDHRCAPVRSLLRSTQRIIDIEWAVLVDCCNNANAPVAPFAIWPPSKFLEPLTKLGSVIDPLVSDFSMKRLNWTADIIDGFMVSCIAISGHLHSMMVRMKQGGCVWTAGLWCYVLRPLRLMVGV